MKNKLVLLILLYGVPFIISQNSNDPIGGYREERSIESDKSQISNSKNYLLESSIGNEDVRLSIPTNRAVIIDRHVDDLVMLGTGEGDTKRSDNGKIDDEDDEKKTLSQQVADGKYGLIPSELFTKGSKRPGIISYLSNPEVPKDNKHSLGGLKSKDIWLAEDHLLVLKGGVFNDDDNKLTDVEPIDDYKAPKRQVKIPSKPQVPPPFPVQLKENGPLEFIEPNGTKHAVDSQTILYPSQGFIPGSGPFFPQATPQKDQISPYAIPFGIQPGNLPAGNGKQIKLPPFPPYPVPPSAYPLPKNIPRKILPPLSVLKNLPPGAVFLPPPANQSDLYDEDDPSIYYPPPYSFYYSNDDENATKVIPGPLVPGIILPPPPDFFAPFENETELPETTTNAVINETSIIITDEVKPPDHNTENKHPSFTTTSKWQSSKSRYNSTVKNTPTVTYKPFKYVTKQLYVKEDKPEKITIDLPLTHENIIPDKVNPKYVFDDASTELKKIDNLTTLRPIKTKLVSVTSSFRPTNDDLYDVKINHKKTRLLTSTPYQSHPKIISQKNLNKTQSDDLLNADNPNKEDVLCSTPETLANLLTSTDDIESNSISPEINIRIRGSAVPTKSNYYYYDDNGNSKSKPNPNNLNKKPRQYLYGVQNDAASPVSEEFDFIPKPEALNLPINGFNRVDPSILDMPPSPVQIQQYQRAINNQIEKIKEEIRLVLAKNQVTMSASARPVYEYSFQAKDYKPITNSIHHIQSLQQFQDYLTSLQNLDQQKQKSQYQQVRPNGQIVPKVSSNLFENNFEQEVGLNSHSRNHNPTKRKPTYVYHNNQNSFQSNIYSKRPAQPVYQPVTTETPISHTPNPHQVQVTPNPTFDNYYTKHDEKYIDDITRHYFTMFGQKISNNEPTTPLSYVKVPSVTPPSISTPLPPSNNQPAKKPIYVYPASESGYKPQPNIQHNNNYNPQQQFSSNYKPQSSQEYTNNFNANPNQQYSSSFYRPPYVPPHNPYAETLTQLQGLNRRPPKPAHQETPPEVSLLSDTLVNYRDPRPGINPDSEFIPIDQISGGHSLAGDTDINQKFPRPTVNPLSESIGVVNNGDASELEDLNGHQEPIRPIGNRHPQRPSNLPNGVSIVSNSYVQQHPPTPKPYVPVQSYYPTNQHLQPPFSQEPNPNGEGSYVSYQLPGNGAHVYFLTPQAVVGTKQDANYYFEEPGQRLRRRNRAPK